MFGKSKSAGKSAGKSAMTGPAAAHPFGSGPHVIHVPQGFKFPDGSSGPVATAQVNGEACHAPMVDSVGGRIVTMDHTPPHGAK